MASLHYEIIQALVLSPACPKCVLVICSPHISTLLQDKKRQAPAPKSFDVATIRTTLADAIGLTGGGGMLANLPPVLSGAFSLTSHSLSLCRHPNCQLISRTFLVLAGTTVPSKSLFHGTDPQNPIFGHQKMPQDGSPNQIFAADVDRISNGS